MIVVSWQRGHISGVSVLFDTSIANIRTEFQVGGLGAGPTEVKVWTMNDI